MAGNVYQGIDIHATNVHLGNTHVAGDQEPEGTFSSAISRRFANLTRGEALLLDEFRSQLFVTNASVDLAKTIRLNGRRIAGTCEWLLARPEYMNWATGDGLQILWLIGIPGIGKTVLSCFLVEHLQKQTTSLPPVVLLYHFCDYKDVETSRNSALGILRCILDQLLKKQPQLFQRIQKEYRHSRERLSLIGSLDGLWATLLEVLQECYGMDIYILVDALDECDKASRRDLLDLLANLAASTNLKVLITTRPDVDVEQTSQTKGRILRVDSGKVNADLAAFIDYKLDELKKKTSFTDSLVKSIELKVKSHVGGTFLWAALVFQDISAAPTMKVALKKLDCLPSDLPGIYKRILDSIDDDVAEDAAFILRWLIASRRPLNVTELATAQVLAHEHWDEGRCPPTEHLERFTDSFKSCGQLLYHDPICDTINLIHRSAKDYLVRGDCPTKYRVNLDDTGAQVVSTCWNYLTFEEFGHGDMFLSRDRGNVLRPKAISSFDRQRYGFLEYAIEEVQDLSDIDRLRQATSFVRSCQTLDSLPPLRDFWLIAFAKAGHTEGVQALIDKGADVGVRSESSVADHMGLDKLLLFPRDTDVFERFISSLWALSAVLTTLQWAAMRGHMEVCKVLIDNGAEIDAKSEPRGETALHLAAKHGQKHAVLVLLDSAATVDVQSCHGATPLMVALREGFDEIGVLLLSKGADASLIISTI